MLRELELKTEGKYSYGDLIHQLLDFGYERVDEIQSPGQFLVQGGLILVFPTNQTMPVRLDFLGDLLEKIEQIDQKSGKKQGQIELLRIGSNNVSLEEGGKIVPGDYVVHEDYGIGIFKAIGLKQVGDIEKSYLYIEYLNGDMLYVPEEMRHRISPYIGVGKRKPKLSRLGSQTWKKTYQKTYENVIHMARELLSLYAVRTISKREPWAIDQVWNEKIVATFPYLETPDQIKATADVFDDLKKDIPMDRLISGDVGFGKTEVAIRAATQAVTNGYQVVMLVPTTILVEQHFVTFKKRFESLPVVIEHLSRFIDSKEQKRIVEATSHGKVDILIGTHRLLGEDITLNNPGLFIIDEEQRFGVKQKEKLKKIREEINVLTLSATPIPRTLFMSLSGIRDISSITTPPGGRKEIATKVALFNEDVVCEYIDREAKRGGQVYYLHNDVSTIEGKAVWLRKKFPELKIEVAHGQMSEERLAHRMSQFAEGKIQVLVCSTIIENGLDLPNANTLIVEESDHFGLSQLYQIRGRIGRSSRQAYALFTYPKKELTTNATKRLKALTEHTELGSGFNIAISDLEIRGGGNILGREQHGNMEAIGLILYSRLLKEAVTRLRRAREVF